MTARSETHTYWFEEHRAGSTAIVPGVPCYGFELDVRLPSGEAPSEARIFVDRRSAAFVSRWSPARPTFRHSLDELRILVEANGASEPGRRSGAKLISNWIRLDHARDGSGPYRVELAPPGELHVELTRESGGAEHLWPWVRIQPANAVADGWSGRGAIPAKQLDATRFVVDELGLGSYVVGVGRGETPPEIEIPVEIVSGVQKIAASLGEPSADRLLKVTCLTPSGEPALGIQFELKINARGTNRSGGGSAIHEGDGSYTIMLPQKFADAASRPSDEIDLTVLSPSHARTWITLRGDEREAVVRLQPMARVTIEARGNVLSGDQVFVEPVSGDREQIMTRSFYSSLDDEGAARIFGAGPGTYWVGATRSMEGSEGSRRAEVLLTYRRVDLVPGDQAVRMEIPRLHDVEVVTTPGEDPVHFDLARSEIYEGPREIRFGRSARSDADGRAIFTDVSPGSYTLTARGDRSNPITVTIPTGAIRYERPSDD